MRSLSAVDLVQLPHLSANECTTLINKLAAQVGPQAPLPASAQAALNGMVSAGQALLAATPSGRIATGTDAADARHATQRHLVAIRSWLSGFTALDPADDARVPLAHDLYDVLFGADDSYISAGIAVEWAETERRIKKIGPQLASAFATLGGEVFWKKLQALHEAEGKVAHITSATAEGPKANRAEALQAATVAIKQYVLMVSSSAVAGQSATQNVADTLLKPLTDWPARSAKRADPAPAAPTTAKA